MLLYPLHCYLYCRIVFEDDLFDIVLQHRQHLPSTNMQNSTATAQNRCPLLPSSSSVSSKSDRPIQYQLLCCFNDPNCIHLSICLHVKCPEQTTNSLIIIVQYHAHQMTLEQQINWILSTRSLHQILWRLRLLQVMYYYGNVPAISQK